MLRVPAGSETVRPSSSSVMMIWQPSREVWVRPKARSSMSSSSSFAAGSVSYHSGSTMTWQVEQASEPSQAPSRSMLLRCAISRTDRPIGASTSTRVPSVLMKVIFGIASLLYSPKTPARRRFRRAASAGIRAISLPDPSRQRDFSLRRWRAGPLRRRGPQLAHGGANAIDREIHLGHGGEAAQPDADRTVGEFVWQPDRAQDIGRLDGRRRARRAQRQRQLGNL